jgi:6,7-dimethyl-8-ribityllumazine synthase
VECFVCIGNVIGGSVRRANIISAMVAMELASTAEMKGTIWCSGILLAQMRDGTAAIGTVAGVGLKV